jgi:hypothetical protein
MFGKGHTAKFAAFAALIAFGLIGFAGVSDAHNPEISARATCMPINTARITLDVVAWNDASPEHRTHNNVVVTLTGTNFAQTFHGAFLPTNDFSFTVTADVPADGQTYSAVATTDEFWGPHGEIVIPIGPQSRSTTVTVPGPCPTSSTTRSSTTTAPTTTVPTTTAPTTAVVGVGVLGAVETAPSSTAPAPATTTAVGTAVQGVVLARTGSNAMPLVVSGATLVLMGSVVEMNARRRRSA